jgi:MFS family permease
LTTSPIAAPDHSAVQRRTLRVLFVSQVAGGVALVIGTSVGALLAAEMVSVGVSGLAQSAAVLGGALFAIPATRIVRGYGRGPSLAAGYLVAAVGAALVVTAAMTDSVPLLFLGYALFGGATAANLQARFAAVDLSPASLYGRHLSIIVWATTIGGVLGPNFAPLAGRTLAPYGVPPLAAPFGFSAVLFTLIAAFLYFGLRPDPLLTARQSRSGVGSTDAPKPHGGMGAAFDFVLKHPAARLGVVATAVGHVVMVGVMSMTPVHIRGAGHGAEMTLRIVGIVISVHVAGMYAFSPVMGWLSDRWGKPRVIIGGVALLLAACLVAGTAGHDSTRLVVGLMLLGLGWSATMVAGSALLSQSIPAELKPSAQGLSDLVMGLAGATSGALAGVVVQGLGYPSLTMFAAAATVPLAVLAINGSRRGTSTPIPAA